MSLLVPDVLAMKGLFAGGFAKIKLKKTRRKRPKKVMSAKEYKEAQDRKAKLEEIKGCWRANNILSTHDYDVLENENVYISAECQKNVIRFYNQLCQGKLSSLPTSNIKEWRIIGVMGPKHGPEHQFEKTIEQLHCSSAPIGRAQGWTCHWFLIHRSQEGPYAVDLDSRLGIYVDAHDYFESSFVRKLPVNEKMMVLDFDCDYYATRTESDSDKNPCWYLDHRDEFVSRGQFLASLAHDTGSDTETGSDTDLSGSGTEFSGSDTELSD